MLLVGLFLHIEIAVSCMHVTSQLFSVLSGHAQTLSQRIVSCILFDMIYSTYLTSLIAVNLEVMLRVSLYIGVPHRLLLYLWHNCVVSAFHEPIQQLHNISPPSALLVTKSLSNISLLTLSPSRTLTCNLYPCCSFPLSQRCPTIPSNGVRLMIN